MVSLESFVATPAETIMMIVFIILFEVGIGIEAIIIKKLRRELRRLQSSADKNC